MTLTDIARAYCERFPKAPTLTLAKKMYAENLECFNSVEQARLTIRSVRGALKGSTIKITHPSIAEDRHRIEPVPEGWVHMPDWAAHQMGGVSKVLVLSDVHVPYHHRTALMQAVAKGQQEECDGVVLNGDLVDFFALSRWEKDPRKRKFAEELKLARQVISSIRSHFPHAKIVLKEGNHEERYERYMWVKAPELLDVAEFKLGEILKLGEQDIELVGDKRPLRIGKLNLIHGHEYRNTFANPVNPARGYFLRAKTHVLGGHYHQSSFHSEKVLDGEVIGTWSTGCLCDLRPDYMPLNQWNHGFAIVDLSPENKFRVHNYSIIKGKIY